MATDTISASTREFLQWVGRQPRSYRETMDAWRSSCPRFTIWEDALAEGLVVVAPGRTSGEDTVSLTEKGQLLCYPGLDPVEARAKGVA